jgi:hypothetical protein
LQTHHLAEECGGCVRGKGQIGGTQFGQLISGTPVGDREGRIGTGRDDQMHLRRQMVNQIRDRLVERWRFEHVVIVHDEGETVGEGGNLVE